jgi:hypothetical protein
VEGGKEHACPFLLLSCVPTHYIGI